MWRWLVGAFLASLCVLGGAAFVVARVDRPLPRLVIDHRAAWEVTVPPHRLDVPWPPGLQAALALPGVARGAVAASPKEKPVPIASLAKLMTAYLTLRLHPLAPGDAGPTIEITPADVQQYDIDVDEDQSSVQVVTGERLTEYQLLQGLIVRSACNFAQLLAVFDAGSKARFVALMNRTATQVGLRGAHFADASGFNPGDVATAADVATLASADMRIPAFADIADEHDVTLPVVGTLANIVARIGTGGIIGIKSGYTIWSGGCVALATKDPDGPGAVVAVVLGQRGPLALHHAANVAEALLDAPLMAIAHIKVITKGQVVGTVRIPWDPQRPVALVAADSLQVTVLAGSALRVRVEVPSSHPMKRPGSHVGTILVEDSTGTTAIPILLKGSIPHPSWWWRLVR